MSTKKVTAKNYCTTDSEKQSRLEDDKLNRGHMVDIAAATQNFYNSSKLFIHGTENYSKKAGKDVLMQTIYVKALKNRAVLAEKKVSYKYDEYGNVQEALQINGTVSCYIYAYNYSLLVAKIENLSFNQIPLGVIKTIVNATDKQDFRLNENNLLAALNNLRTSLAFFRDIKITTFTHTPLVGVKSITDAEGQTTSF